MATSTAPGALSTQEIVELSKAHTFFPWAAQGAVDPIAIDHASGVYLYTPDGQRILDFNAGLMSVNIGHGDRRVIDAVAAQMAKLQFVQPAMVTESRARLGRKLAEIMPGDLDKVFLTLGGAEAVENAIKLARHATGRLKILARYRTYHGASMGAMTLTGDPRRWANEPGIVGVVRYPDTHRWGEAEPRPAAEALQGLEDVIRYEGAHTIAAIFLEPVVGTNGILIPPDGYVQGVRELCDRHGILMVADEVMSGFGRTGKMFAIDHWGVVPDLMTMAKGLTSSYLPLGAVAMSHRLAEKFESIVYSGGLTYGAHPVSCAAAVATLDIYETDGLVENAARMGEVLRAHHQRLKDKHPSVGAIRSIGLFGCLELVRSRDPYTPLTPFNGNSDEMKAIAKFLRDNGLYTMIAGNIIHTNPPLIVNEAQLAEGFELIDRALDISDRRSPTGHARARGPAMSAAKEAVGFIGLGIMGKPMALNLLKAGFRVVAHSRSQGPVDEVVAAGAERASTPSEVASLATIVVTMLPDTPDLEVVVRGAYGLLGALGPDHLLIDMSTVDPIATRDLADVVQETGAGYLDAPVSGGQQGAEDATLSIMVGGAATDVARAMPVFQALGRTIVHVGEIGAGQITKAANQLVVASTLQAVAEALTLAEAAGVDPAKVRQALLGGFAASRILDVHGQRMLDDNFQPGFRASLHLKDLQIVKQTAIELGLELPGLDAVFQQMDALVDSGRGELDHSALVLLQRGE